MSSWSEYTEVTQTAFSESRGGDPFNDFLGLIDVDFLTACEHTNFYRTLSGVGRRLPPAHGHFLGAGGSYIVRRIPYNAGEHRVAALGEPERDPKPDFVVLKQQVFHSGDQINFKDSDIHRFRAAMLEMKILRHQPIRDHPNIINLLQTRWDFQDDFNLTLPSVVMDYGDFGTLADFQNSEMLAQPLTTDTKKDICLDIAQGLQFLHDCGVIHGDVKPENVLLCKHPKYNDAYLAKLSDFDQYLSLISSSLIEVGDGLQKQPLRRLTRGTVGWRAPNQGVGLLDTSALRGVDVYSYGLLVWSVMLDGTEPWKVLVKTQQRVVMRHSSSVQPGESGVIFSAEQFDLFKQDDREEMVSQLARQSLEGADLADVDVQTVGHILQWTLQEEPKSRVTNFNKIIAALGGRGGGSKIRDVPNNITPRLLKHGDFHLDSLWLPWQMFSLSTCPLPFRKVMYMEMFRVMGELDDLDQRKAQLRLGLAISHYQGFAPNPDMRYAAELVYQAAKAGNKKAQQMCQPCFRRCEMPSPPEVDIWLKEGVQRGSFLARKCLAKVNPTVLGHINKQVIDARQRLGDRWIRSIQKHGVDWLRSDQSTAETMDELFEFFVKRDGVTPLHKAALTGNGRLVKRVVSQGAETNITNSHGETALHYAAISGSLDAIQVLDPNASSLNIESSLKATPLHYAILGSASTEVLHYLCESGADLNVPSDSMDSFQQFISSDYYFRLSGTALVWATVVDNGDAVYALLTRGADPFRGQPNSYDLPAWCVAFSNRSVDIIRMMFSPTVLEKPNFPQPEFDEIVPYLGSQLTTPLRLLLHGALPRKDFVQSILEMHIWKHHAIDKALVIFECLDIQLFQEDVVDIVNDIIAEKCFKPGTDYGVCRYRYPGTSNYATICVSLESFLSVAIRSSSIEMVRMLFRYIRNLKSTFAPPSPQIGPTPSLIHEESSFFELLCYSRLRNEHEIGDMVECLLAHGADKNVKSRTTWPEDLVTYSDPLEVAAGVLQVEIVKVFLDHDIGNVWVALAKMVGDPNSLLALRAMSAILEKRPDILLAAIPQPTGLEINAGDMGLLAAQQGSNGLHACLTILCTQGELDRSDAITEKKVKIIEKALQSLPGGHGALTEAVRTRDILGSTLLHHAATNGNMRLCEFLLKSGADVNAETTFMPLIPNLPAVDLPTTPLVMLPSSLPSEHPPESAMPFTFSPPKGPTPLDNAKQRNWIKFIQGFIAFAKEMMEMHCLGGDHKQQKDFQGRTGDVVKLLQDRGGKPSSGL